MGLTRATFVRTYTADAASVRVHTLIKLPKELVDDPRHDAALEILSSRTAPLWDGGRNSVPTVPLTDSLVLVLRHALHVGLAVQGLELITEKLSAEQLGIDAVNQKSGADPSAPRVSRLLFVANDGSKRFYRDCDGLLTRYERRLLGCRVDLAGQVFGTTLFSEPKLVRAVLVTDKKVVSRALTALLEP